MWDAIFEAFGNKPLGRMVAATAIGALAGLFGSQNLTENSRASRVDFVLGGALVGLFAGIVLVLADRRRKNLEARGRSGGGTLFAVTLVLLAALVVIVGSYVWTVYL